MIVCACRLWWCRWVWETVRGIDNEPVTPKSLVKSINSCKSFEPTSDPAAVSKWLTVLAAELAERMAEDEADHSRRARTLGEQQPLQGLRLCRHHDVCDVARQVDQRPVVWALSGGGGSGTT